MTARLDLDLWICDAQAGIAMGGGGSQTVQEQPQPTAQQTALTQAQVDLAHEQLAELQKADAWNQQVSDAVGPLIPAEAQLLQDQLDQANSPVTKQVQDAQNQLTLLNLNSAIKDQPIQDQILQLQLENLQNGGAATPEQQALIDQATKAGIDSGTSQINDWVSDATRQIAQQLAPQLGLRPTDQPIVDRAGQIAKQAVSQIGQLQSNLQGAGASAKLNLPLAVQQVQSSVGSAAASLQTQQQAFAAELAQQANANRLQLFGGANSLIGGTGSLGLGLAGIGPNFNTGPMGSTQTTNTQTDNTGQIIGAVGGLALGAAAVF